MPKEFETKWEDWESIAKQLRTLGKMREEDVDAAGKLGSAIHTLDKLVFPSPLPFTFYPSRSSEPSPGGHLKEHYFIYVDGFYEDLLKFEDELKTSWPQTIAWTISEDLCLYSLAAEIVRLRAQEELLVEPFSPSHAGKITKIPILNKIIEANTLIIAKSQFTSERFDAHVIGSFAAQVIGENKRDKLLSGVQITQMLAEIVKLDANKVI